jgi:mono/diheme cytochrome c family protein
MAIAHASQQTTDSASLELYEKKIRPLFAEQCYACHGAKQQLSGLRLDRKNGVAKGGNRGPLFAAGSPEKSLIVKAVGYADIHLRMPPKAKLKDEEIAAVTEWVKLGAPMPAESRESKVESRESGAPKKDDWPQRLQHWAYQRIRRPVVPLVRDPKSDIRNPIDAFLDDKLRKKGLTPSARADKRTLIRRVTFDLIGLPPTPAEVDAFLGDKSPKAYEKLVDRLLASPHYGERWGRHWLDLVRYSETLGHEFDYDLYNAWRYRDYVIRAFNADLPYDQLAMEHVAGDLMPKPRRNPTDGSNESIVGTAFWWMGEGKHSPVDVRQEQADRMDNQIDVFGKAFLGQTLACARCHDHKFDPIRSRDYYAMAGYMRSSRYQQAFLDAPGRIAEKAKKLDGLREAAKSAFWSQAAQKERSPARYISAAVKLSGSESADSPIFQSIARENGLDASRLAGWAKAVRSPECAQPAHPLYAISRLIQSERMPFAHRAAELKAELERKEQEARQSASSSYLFEDFNMPDYEGWSVTGDAFGSGPTQLGDLTNLSYSGINSSLQRIPGLFFATGAGVAHSGLNSPRLEGVLRSKNFTVEKPYILIRAAGRDSRINVVLDGFQLIRDPIYGPCHLELNDDKMGWRVMDLSLWKGHHAYLEMSDITVPVLSQGGLEGAASRLSKGYLAVDEIRFSDSPVPPSTVDPVNMAVLDGAPPESIDTLAARYEELFQRAACSMGDQGARQQKLDGLAVELARLSGSFQTSEEFAKIEETIPAPTYVPALVDGPGEDEDIFLRGNYKTPGAKAPRTLLQICAAGQAAAGVSGSGRLDLAKRLVSPANPLFARVMVNRVWLHHFGEGIVRTPDDFGKMGQRPTHPELLGWLAAAFTEGDYNPHPSPNSHRSYRSYSLKALHRLILTSNAYQRSTTPTAKAAQLDPQNKLLSHMPVHRLEAEAIRDAILRVSGRLDEKMGGQGVLTYLTPFMEGRGKPASGPLDGDGRRSIYIAVRRNFLTPMFLAFDYPTPFSCMGRRSVSNVPAQALSLMNGPFVLQQARLWAERTLADRSLVTPEKRIASLYQTAFCRPPTKDEEREGLRFVAGQAERYHAQAEDPRVWADLCHVLFNVKEFIFLN